MILKLEWIDVRVLVVFVLSLGWRHTHPSLFHFVLLFCFPLSLSLALNCCLLCAFRFHLFFARIQFVRFNCLSFCCILLYFIFYICTRYWFFDAPVGNGEQKKKKLNYNLHWETRKKTVEMNKSKNKYRKRRVQRKPWWCWINF